METEAVRSVTLTRARRSDLVFDLLLQTIRSGRGKRRLLLWAVLGGWVGYNVAGWPGAVGLVAVAALLQALAWWWRADRALPRREVGRTWTVDYAESGDLVLSDGAEQAWFARGTAAFALRDRGLVTILSRSGRWVVPGELLSDDDLAFLEGHGEQPEAGAAPGPNLPLALEVTQDVQDDVVRAATRRVLLSADSLVAPLCVLFISGVFAAARAWTAVAVVVGLFLVLLALEWSSLRGLRRRLREHYAVGRTLRAAVTETHLVLATPPVTQQQDWRAFSAHRVTPTTVELVHRRGPLTTTRTEVLPRGLFDDESIDVLARALPGRSR